MSGGWVLLHRTVWDSPDFKPEPFSEREAFIWSVSQAAHSPHLQWFNGQQIAIERGEFATSSRKLAAVFKWSEKRARAFMGRMKTGGNWTLRTPHQSPHLATIISICNYDRFQSPTKRKDAPEDAPKGAPRTHPGRTEDAQQKEGIKNGEEGERSSKASPSPAPPYAEAVSIWTEFASLNGWSPVSPTLPLSDKRRKGLGKILSAHGLDGWRSALQRAADSEMLGGHDPPAWFNFAFICKPDNFTKLIEGNYDRSFNNHDKPKQSPWVSANARLGGSAGYAAQPKPDEQQRLLECSPRTVESQGGGVR